jgi:hypothetical protein
VTIGRNCSFFVLSRVSPPSPASGIVRVTYTDVDHFADCVAFLAVLLLQPERFRVSRRQVTGVHQGKNRRRLMPQTQVIANINEQFELFSREGFLDATSNEIGSS